MIIVQISTSYRQYLDKKNKPSSDQLIFYILLKGCLHRCDHSGSAHLDVEIDPCRYSRKQRQQQITNYLVNTANVKQNEIWQYPVANSCHNDNVILQAGTGSGKTEFALYWLGFNKAFYTLPMRTSVNAMYERMVKTYQSNNIGLIHADTALYTLSKIGIANISRDDGSDDDAGLNDALARIDISRQLSMPLSVCTADQIFTSAFKYKGYEKIFATLAYSRLIVDEIQSYDPAIVAIILKTLVDIQDIGCKFCITTATLPKMYLRYLHDKVKNFNPIPPRFNATPRHKVKLLSNPINHSEIIDIIVSLSKKRLGKKHTNVLIIVNTVKMAQEIKRILNSRNVPSNLLHSMFVYEDRDIKESCILAHQRGIWITTQIAEVSLNIDFDIMVTEISTIDSQVQRWGRVWRNRKVAYDNDQPNIYVTPNPSDSGYIYDKDLVRCTLKMMYKKVDKNDAFLLSDLDEYNLVQDVFDDESLKLSKYNERLDASRRLLSYGLEVDTKHEAQQLFRSISNMTVIPSEVYHNSKEIIDDAISTLKDYERHRLDRLKALFIIRNKTVSVPYFYLRDIIAENEISVRRKDRDLLTVDMKYSEDLGVELATVNSAYFLS